MTSTMASDTKELDSRGSGVAMSRRTRTGQHLMGQAMYKVDQSAVEDRCNLSGKRVGACFPKVYSRKGLDGSSSTQFDKSQ